MASPRDKKSTAFLPASEAPLLMSGGMLLDTRHMSLDGKDAPYPRSQTSGTGTPPPTPHPPSRKRRPVEGGGPRTINEAHSKCSSMSNVGRMGQASGDSGQNNCQILHRHACCSDSARSESPPPPTPSRHPRIPPRIIKRATSDRLHDT